MHEIKKNYKNTQNKDITNCTGGGVRRSGGGDVQQGVCGQDLG